MKNNTTVVYTPVESSKLGVESAFAQTCIVIGVFFFFSTLKDLAIMLVSLKKIFCAILLRGHEAYRCIWGILLYSIEEE